MQLVKGNGTFTSGVADVRSFLDGDYSEAPAFPGVSCYMIFTSQDKLETWILVVNNCYDYPTMYILAGHRSNASEKFAFNSDWKQMLDRYYVEDFDMRFSGLSNSYNILNNNVNNISLEAGAEIRPQEVPAIQDTPLKSILQSIWHKLKPLYRFWSNGIATPTKVMTAGIPAGSSIEQSGYTTLADLKSSLGFDENMWIKYTPQLITYSIFMYSPILRIAMFILNGVTVGNLRNVVIPAAYRPKAFLSFTVIQKDSATNQPIISFGTIDEDGIVSISSSISTGIGLRQTITWAY
jgi:hypothetical protein